MSELNPISLAARIAGTPSKESVLLAALDPASSEHICAGLKEELWRIFQITSSTELIACDPRQITGLLVDSSFKPLADDVLNFCELSDVWRSIPKILITPNIIEYSNTMRIPPNAVQPHLLSYLRTAQVDYQPRSRNESDRRQHYRHRCNTQVKIRHTAKLVDVSVGGAALEMSYGPPVDMKITVPVNEKEPVLAALEGEVLSSNCRAPNTYMVHVRFTNVTPALERAMQRLILGFQMRRFADQ